MTTTAVFGSTGFVGSHILSTLLGLDSVKAVHTVSRRAPKAEGSKLSAHVEGDNSKWTTALSSIAPPPEVVYSSVGTTRVAAGGIANQWKIDHDLNVEIAKAAKASGVKTFVFISSGGTRGFLADRVPYSQMKQGVEDTIQSLGFEQAIIVRPGFILGEREAGPKHATTIAHTIVDAMPGMFKDKIGQHASVIGRAAVNAAVLAQQGKAPSKYWVIEQADVLKLGRDDYKLDSEAKPTA
ncbi:hypothetical protein JX266_005230 [Neoarthrinium moseri]|uniref:uncharacterized protein n=1 Tax=Neoarthrinium moseri TaxID=1658444 RepID=UPI001FDB8190|nr:uncharacterized protein JN550_007306 [Neoarthrinium moseri]KAI1848802.1 hypothetical protein JX266_005230 [Neoarthrinium moseri]KAI1866759.1 hypothetical protein JN550_007306 [Neoarthrinium moseri]